jgi:hypothetical protein
MGSVFNTIAVFTERSIVGAGLLAKGPDLTEAYSLTLMYSFAHRM